MDWKPFKLGGASYELAHLKTKLMEVTPTAAGAAKRKVKVSFGCHTFTRELWEADKPDLHFRHGGEVRAFCTERHRHSLNLPTIVDLAAAGGRAYFSKKENFLLVDTEAGVRYAVFFNMIRSRSSDCDVVMFVVSAYPKPNLPLQLLAITFPTLVATVAAGKPVIKPTRKIKY